MFQTNNYRMIGYMIIFIISYFTMGKITFPTKYLPGRKEAMKIINDKHYVLKTNIYGPFNDFKQIVLGTGCFWGAELKAWRLPGVITTAVGYCGGQTPNPTYEEVCSGDTGHNEVVLVVYDEKKVTTSDILRLFFEMHDPTQGMGQGNDRGTQYRSGIYYTTEEQSKLAHHAKDTYETLLKRPITTEIKKLENFYYAEEYHQQYLAKPNARPYCSAAPTGISLKSFPNSNFKLGEDYWNKYAPISCSIRGPFHQILYPFTSSNV